MYKFKIKLRSNCKEKNVLYKIKVCYNNQLIFENYFYDNEDINLVCNRQCIQIIIIPQDKFICPSYCNIFANLCYKNCFIFYFNKYEINSITIKLVDKNYDGLFIKEGKIHLWENHIQ